MKRDMDRVGLRGLCILSAILLGAGLGGAWQTASAADQTVDLTGPVEPSSAVEPAVAPGLGSGFSYTRIGNYEFNAGTNDLVPLTDPPSSLLQSAAFAAPASGKFLVTYTAHCIVKAPAGNTETFVNIDMRLINTVTLELINLPPSTPNSLDAFCTANGTAVFDGYTMNTITGVATGIPAGDYRVRVRANLGNAVLGASGQLGSSSLVIKR